MNARSLPSDHMSEALPWSAEAEQAVIGSVLHDNRAFDRAQVEAEQFFDARHRVIWSSVQALINASKPADVITVLEHLQNQGKAEDAGGLAHINALAQCVASARNIGAYAQVVREKAALRELRAKLIDGLEITGGDGDVATKVAQIVGSLSELQRQAVKSVPQHIAEAAIAGTTRYEDLQAGRIAVGMPTHIRRLDDTLLGLACGRLYLLGARPAVGKSSFAEQIALNVAKDGNPTLFLSQEMSKQELTDRAVANLGRVNYARLQAGGFQDDDWDRISGAVDELARMPLHIDDQPQLTMAHIRLKAQMIPGLKLLVVDYLQLCASTRKDGNRNGEIEEISRGLKSLAKELDIAVIALSQLNRAVETRTDREPTLSDLRDSGAIEQDADVVMFLWPVAQHATHSLVGCKVDKNRSGQKGRFGLHFEGALQRWSESTASIDFKPAQPRRKGFGDD